VIWSRPISIHGALFSARAGRQWLSVCFLFLFSSLTLRAAEHKPATNLWVLQPVVRPDVPAGVTQSKNPIDAFIAAEYKTKGLTPVGLTDKRTLCGACISI
jgi:hypothetical protein